MCKTDVYFLVFNILVFPLGPAPLTIRRKRALPLLVFGKAWGSSFVYLFFFAFSSSCGRHVTADEPPDGTMNDSCSWLNRKANWPLVLTHQSSHRFVTADQAITNPGRVLYTIMSCNSSSAPLHFLLRSRLITMLKRATRLWIMARIIFFYSFFKRFLFTS